MPRQKVRIVPLLNTLDPSKGRINLGFGFSIDKIRGLLNGDTFRPFMRKLSQEDLESILAWDLCLIHEFQSDLTHGEDEETSQLLMRFLVAACRWVSPTQTTDTWFAQGFIDSGRALAIPLFSARPGTTMTVPEFSARPQTIFLEDCEARTGPATPEKFLDVAPFLRPIHRIVTALRSGIHSFVPIIVAVRLSEQAYLEFDVHLRLLKRVMALEALFSTGDTYGKKALVPRVGKFVGEKTLIYPNSKATYSVGATIGDICDLRNALAHGDVVPAKFLDAPPESEVSSVNVRSYADVLREASAVMLRLCLLNIFGNDLVGTFSDKSKMEALF